MSSNFIYYVYAYIRKSDGTPYYIGKGKRNRAFDKRHNVTVPDKAFILILESNLSEIGALALERRLIKWWGRKDIDTGILHNKTDGGDGRDSSKHSEETKSRMSKAHLGKKKSERAKLKMSIAARSRKLNQSTKDKLSEINRGKILSNKTKNLISNTMKMLHGESLQFKCPHCNFWGKGPAMKRWHFSNCKILREEIF